MSEICFNCKGVSAECLANYKLKARGKKYSLALCTEAPPTFRIVKSKRKCHPRFCLIGNAASVILTHREVRDFLKSVPAKTWQAIGVENFADSLVNDSFYVATKAARPSGMRTDQTGRESMWFDPETLLTEQLVRNVRSAYEMRHSLHGNYFFESVFSDPCVVENSPNRKRKNSLDAFQDKDAVKKARKDRRKELLKGDAKKPRKN